MSFVVGVELERIWSSLGPRPEGGAARGDRVLGEVVEELLDLVGKLRLEEDAGPGNAVLKRTGSLGGQIVADSLQRLLLVAALLKRGLDEVGLCQVEVDSLGGLDKGLFKHVLLGPGNGVLNLVGEAADCAHGEFLLGGVLGRGVGLCQMRQDNLGVALGAQGSALEQRLSEEDASSVDIGSRLDIVQGVGDTVQAPPEFLVEDVLSLGTNALSQRLNVAFQLGVHSLHGLGSAVALHAADISGSEKELSVQVALLDRVHVGHVNLAVGARAQSNHGPVLQHLTANGTSADEELLEIGNLVLIFSSKDGNLAIVAATDGLAQLGTSLGCGGERLE